MASSLFNMELLPFALLLSNKLLTLKLVLVAISS